MLLHYQQFTIRNAIPEDAQLLSAWWNDGKIMAHAGFPNGTGQTPQQIAESLTHDSDDTRRRLVIERGGIPIGEMNFINEGDGVADIGIKICNFSEQEKGYGRLLLSMFLDSLFHAMGFQKIVLSTNLNNTRAHHVYELLGFKRDRVEYDSWEDQVGVKQSIVYYELLPSDFISFLK